MIHQLTSGLKKLFPLTFALFLVLPGNSIAEETMCKDLKKVNNLDELLYQFYINLDSDCLFTMPLAELEKAWGIKILSIAHLQPEQPLETYSKLREGTDFKGKPYHSEMDAFYVDANQLGDETTGFAIYITKAYREKYLTLFPEGNFPKLLPDPVKRLEQFTYDPCPPGSCEDLPRRPQTPGKYGRDYIYYWLNTDRTHMIYMQTGLTEAITTIHIFSKMPPDFLKNRRDE